MPAARDGFCLERDGGGAGDRRECRGRTLCPERLQVVALALDVLTRLLADVHGWTDAAAVEWTAGPRRRQAR